MAKLAFHPSHSHVLLSGSTDSLVNIYDTNVADEDDVLIKITNHGSSIHHTGFLSKDTFFGLSHDETFSLYHFDPTQRNDEEAEEAEMSGDLALGDLREILNCEYVVDVLHGGDDDGESAMMVAGSHRSAYLALLQPQHSSSHILTSSFLLATNISISYP